MPLTDDQEAFLLVFTKRVPANGRSKVRARFVKMFGQVMIDKELKKKQNDALKLEGSRTTYLEQLATKCKWWMAPTADEITKTKTAEKHSECKKKLKNCRVRVDAERRRLAQEKAASGVAAEAIQVEAEI
ncbi:hypothetical protein MMC13_008517 [Lambiella insularis]|nr:hypothetical protein [Lambiella insularis]